MKVSTIDHESLFKELSAGMWLITGNSRLPRVLASQYGQWRMEKGARQWPSPVMLSWDAWLGKLWEEAGLNSHSIGDLAVPGAQQLVSLWQNVLRNDPNTRLLLRPESLATRLRDTRRIAVDWRLDFHHASWIGDENENHRAFQRWNRTFGTLCRENNWIAPEDRTALLCQNSLLRHTEAGSGIGLLGFDEFNPAQQELLAALLDAGHSVQALEMNPSAGPARLWKSRDSREELQQMARWVRYWSEEEPSSRIAVIVPDLQARRSEIERHLAQIMVPAKTINGDRVLPWNLSLGVPLARVPMIESAFDILRLLDKRIDIQDIGRVLRSPWFRGSKSERNSRALLEKCLRENYPRQLSLGEVRYRAGEVRKHDRNGRELPPGQHEPRAWNSAILAGQLSTLIGFERDSRGSRAPSEWAETFDGLLLKLGWPRIGKSTENQIKGEDSEVWQTFQAWQEGLRELASLDATEASLGRQAAINQLLQVCRERIFQPRTPQSNIQVLGLYEASGLRFDHLWVMGLHNGNWPAAAQPNPFIPGLLQQKAQLPHSSPRRELEVARGVTRRLLESAEDCLFSYPGQLDGEDVLPSPLLMNKSVQPVAAVEGWPGDDWQTTVGGAKPPEINPLESPGPPRHETARGGSSILKNQALCPFRAYASNRLGAEGMQTPVEGISPMQHGSLVHRVLENFWKETLTHAALIDLKEGELHDRIRRCVDQVLNSERSFHDRPEFRDVEGRRLERLAAASLELEKTRGAFEVVGFEQEVLQDIEGQPIRLYIDRIDRLPGGGEVIIDYKTGKVDPRKWFGSRPEDPQLPLYAISAATAPAAIVFAVIRDDECLYNGVVTRDGIFPGLPPASRTSNKDIIEAGEYMEVTINTWRQTLHRLMSRFLSGEASIDPKNGRSTCTNSYCELQPLCRITELEQRGKLREGAAKA